MSCFIFRWGWDNNIVRARHCRAPTIAYNYAVFRLFEDAEKFFRLFLVERN
jgi:hypothetical protein